MSDLGLDDASDDASPDARERLVRGLRAGARGLLLVTAEERRAIELLERAGEDLGWPVHTWSASAGLDDEGAPGPLSSLLSRLAKSDDDGLWVILDVAPELEGAAVRRAFRELAQRHHGPAVVGIDPTGRIHRGALQDLIPELWVLPVPPADRELLRIKLASIAQALEDAGFPAATDRLHPASDRITSVAVGLQEHAFEQLVAEAVLAHGLDPGRIEGFIAREKTRRIDGHGLLLPVQPAPAHELGGLERFKAWLTRRALALRPQARAAGIAPPRGTLLIGVQGCGKSLAARVCGPTLGLPILRLDLGSLFGGTVGESEANLRQAMAAAERMAPLVLWIDEIDKGLAGTGGSRSDAGTSARVLGTFLTWLQERRACVFVVATANEVGGLPPELLRRGRLDEVFFVDLPDAATRAEILRIHLVDNPGRRLGRPPPMAGDLAAFEALARRAEGFSGAELEGALTEARLDAFAAGRPIAPSDLELALSATVPLAVSRSEEISALRRWASTRARPA